MVMQAILISKYDDETAVLTMILQRAGLSVRSVREISNLGDTWLDQPMDIILIAVPDDTPQLINEIHQLRQHTTVPIVLITSSEDENQLVTFLEKGIDCLIHRPYGIRYLAAMVGSLLRRTAGTALFNLPVLHQRDVSLDPSTRAVTVGERDPVRLTRLEFRLLHTLLINAGQIIPIENLVEFVWGYSGEGNQELVRGLVQRLRSKMEPDPPNPRYIINTPGIGYSFKTEN
jgi:two-component system KDP operon response regulator KdpE